MASNYLRDWRRLKSRANDEAQDSDAEDDAAENNAAQECTSLHDSEESTTSQQGELPLVQQGLSDDASELPGTSTDEQLMATCSDSDSDAEQTLDSEHDVVDSSQSDEDHFETDDIETGTLAGDLAQWATSNNQTLTAVNGLLTVLRKHGHRLPKDARTLLQTPKDVECQFKCNGQYAYYGLESGILDYLTKNATFTGDIELTFNVDGVPVFKSSKNHFWPILATCNDADPFIVALYFGKGKPEPLTDYLQDLLEDLAGLLEKGVEHQNVVHKVGIRAFICDAPARAFLKCIKGHNASQGCERCEATATRIESRMVYTSTDVSPSRTDEMFRQLKYVIHQKTPSPLLDVGILCVNQFPLDYMHLVCLGVVKRILVFLIRGPSKCKLLQRQQLELSERLLSLKGSMPGEFARQPRALDELDRWKATEYRQFLLYTGPVVLRSVLPKPLYSHFLTLTVSMSILLESDTEKRNEYLDYARDLMIHFVDASIDLYGQIFPTYNVHSLKHLHEDVRFFKCSLNDLSCFPFENHLQVIKKMVRNSRNPVVQVTKRVAEKAETHQLHKRRRHTRVISAKPQDRCFLLRNEDFAFINEKRGDGTVVVDVLSPDDTADLFQDPCSSKLFNIVYVGSFERAKRKLVRIEDLDRKAVCLPYQDGFAIFPLLHAVEN